MPIRPALALFASVFCLAACAEPGDPMLSGMGGAPEPIVIGATCGEPGVPVITEVTVAWDPEREGAIAVELHGLACGARVEGLDFTIFDDAERDITGRSWPEVELAETDYSEGAEQARFVLRGFAAGCADYRDAVRIELSATARVGRCGFSVSDPISVALP